MSPKCPKCKRDNIKVKSKRKYFSRATLFAIIVICCSAMLWSLKDKAIGPIVIMGVVVSLLTAGLAVVLGSIYFIKGNMIMVTSYHCRYCKEQFTEMQVS